MITCELKGGLGNQLFQIFTTIAYSLQHKVPFYFNNDTVLGNGANGSTIRYTYWNSFLRSLQPFLRTKQTNIVNIIYEPSFNYNEIPEMHSGVSMLIGYYQSYKYFNKYAHSIITLLKIGTLKQKLYVKYLKYNFNNSISIHFRIGDYVKYPDIHPILNEKYYIESILHILGKTTNKSNLKILYFCEDEDLSQVINKIDIIKLAVPNIIFERCKPEYDWEELLLMSLCQHNIIANSSFSWWGAYLNNNINKIICYPSKWFGSKKPLNTIDLFPENWIKM